MVILKLSWGIVELSIFNSFLCGLGGVLLLILRFWEILVSGNFCLLVQRC